MKLNQSSNCVMFENDIFNWSNIIDPTDTWPLIFLKWFIYLGKHCFKGWYFLQERKIFPSLVNSVFRLLFFSCIAEVFKEVFEMFGEKMVHIIFLTKFIFMLRKRKLSSKEKELNIIIQGVLTVKQKTFYFLLRVFFNCINSIQNFYRTVTFWYMIFYIFVYLYEF